MLQSFNQEWKLQWCGQTNGSGSDIFPITSQQSALKRWTDVNILYQKKASESQMLQNPQGNLSGKKPTQFLLQTTEENIVHQPQ